jgi:hypothetical protein
LPWSSVTFFWRSSACCSDACARCFHSSIW